MDTLPAGHICLLHEDSLVYIYSL